MVRDSQWVDKDQAFLAGARSKHYNSVGGDRTQERTVGHVEPKGSHTLKGQTNISPNIGRFLIKICHW